MSESCAFNRDCLEAMKEFPDKFFDLAVVDPPYGGGAAASTHTHTHTQAASSVERQTLKGENGHGSVEGLTATISTTRTGGGWFKRKYAPERTGRRA